MYLEKQGNTLERDQGRRVALDLVSILGPGHGITTDNFFASLELAEDFIDKKLTLCGTLRRNKTCIPPEFMPARNRDIYSSNFWISVGNYMGVLRPKSKPKCYTPIFIYNTKIPQFPKREKKTDIITQYNATEGFRRYTGRIHLNCERKRI